MNATSTPTISPAWLGFYQECERLADIARQRRAENLRKAQEAGAAGQHGAGSEAAGKAM